MSTLMMTRTISHFIKAQKPPAKAPAPSPSTTRPPAPSPLSYGWPTGRSWRHGRRSPRRRRQLGRLLPGQAQVAFEVIGNDLTVTMAAEPGQLQLNAFEPIIARSIFASLTHLQAACTTLADHCIDGITANKEYLRSQVESSIGVVTILNPLIGYDAATSIAREALATGRSATSLVLERGLLSVEELEDILRPELGQPARSFTGTWFLQQAMPTTAKSYVAYSADSELRAGTVERRDPGDFDVQIAVKYTGICHSDIHARDPAQVHHWPTRRS